MRIGTDQALVPALQDVFHRINHFLLVNGQKSRLRPEKCDGFLIKRCAEGRAEIILFDEGGIQPCLARGEKDRVSTIHP